MVMTSINDVVVDDAAESSVTETGKRELAEGKTDIQTNVFAI